VRAVVLNEYGGPEVLTIADVAEPRPGPEDIVVEIRATALNRADVLQRMGLYPGPPMEHEIPGLEFAGTVVDAGDRVIGVGEGDEVMGIVGGGSYADRIAVHHRQVMAVPDTVPLADATAIPEVFLTAWDALVRQGGLTSGRRALVHAGASGVGTAATQIATAIGASVAVTASAAKHDVCRAQGADLVIDYRSTDFADAISGWTDGEGVDVVLDVVGGEYLNRNIASLRVGGTVVQVGVMDPSPPTFALGALLPKRATLVGTVLRARPLEEKIALTRQFAREVLPLFDHGPLRPVIDSRYPLEQVGAAHERMESNANAGKILVDISGS